MADTTYLNLGLKYDNANNFFNAIKAYEDAIYLENEISHWCSFETSTHLPFESDTKRLQRDPAPESLHVAFKLATIVEVPTSLPRFRTNNVIKLRNRLTSKWSDVYRKNAPLFDGLWPASPLNTNFKNNIINTNVPIY